MKTKLLWLATIIVVGAVCVRPPYGLAQDPPPACPEQVFLDIPADVDREQIVTDPGSGQKLYLGKYTAIVGVPVTIVGRACDPDDDDVRAMVYPSGPELVLDPNGVYEFSTFYPQAGTHYIHVSAVDPYGAERRGTWVVVVRANRPPSLCAGRP
jgi:hypothetical protein